MAVDDPQSVRSDPPIGEESSAARGPRSRERSNPASEDPLDDLGAGDDATPLIGQVVADRYRIEGLIGRGGMGAVYRADHVHIRKSFALKVLHRELTHHAEAVKRFEREAIAAARIDHPNVATAVDFGRLPSGAFYLVLDYVQGRTLRELLGARQPLHQGQALRIARQIASALAAAHAAGIVHRDLKPDNVMLVETPTDPEFVKVLDFGIAKLRTEDISDEPAITKFGAIFGTPEYMSPEQARGQSVDARSDLYSLGIMLYEMLTGKTPFADDQLVLILTRQMTETPAPLPAHISPDTRRLVMQLLEKDPEARPPSAEAVVAWLDRQLGHEEVTSSGNWAADAASSKGLDADWVNGQTFLASAPGRSVAARAAEAATSYAEPHAAAARAFVPNATPSLPPWLKRPVVVVGRPIPMVLLIMGAATLSATLMGIVGGWALFAHPDPATSSSSSSSIISNLVGGSAESKQVAQWIEYATNGDPVALEHLEQRPQARRSPAEWAAIATGRIKSKQWGSAVEAYEHALALDPQLAATPRVLTDIYWAATADPQSSPLALDLAAKRLGSSGADLVFAVYEAATTNRAPKADRRKARSLLDSEGVTNQASPALRIAVRLESARTCSDFRNLLERVATEGDQRCQRKLRPLTAERGCGLLSLQDCYPCLRAGRALNDALAASKSRPGPVFPDPPPSAGNRPTQH